MSDEEMSDEEFSVKELVASFATDEPGDTARENENIDRFNYLLPILSNKSRLKPNKFLLSQSEIHTHLVQFLSELKDKENPVQAYHDRFEEFEQNLFGIEVEKYTIAFPLNLKIHESVEREEYKSLDMTYERIEQEEWKENIVPGVTGIDLGSIEIDDKNPSLYAFKSFIVDSVNDIYSNDYTFWKASCYGRDSRYALTHVTNALQILLARLNFSINYNKKNKSFGGSGPRRSRWADLREPFIYLIFKDSEFLYHAYSGDPSLRKPERVTQWKAEQFDTVFSDLPDLSESTSVDDDLIAGLKAFQSAITSPNSTEAFFDFWRGLEVLTQTNEDNSMSDITKRAESFISWSEPGITSRRIDRLRDLRNNMVHGGIDVSATTEDRNLMKILLESLLNLYFSKRHEWTSSDFEFVLSLGNKDNSEIEDIMRRKQKQMDLLKEISEWYPDNA